MPACARDEHEAEDDERRDRDRDRHLAESCEEDADDESSECHRGVPGVTRIARAVSAAAGLCNRDGSRRGRLQQERDKLTARINVLSHNRGAMMEYLAEVERCRAPDEPANGEPQEARRPP